MFQYEVVVWAYNGGQLRIADYVKLFRSVSCMWGLVMAGGGDGWLCAVR